MPKVKFNKETDQGVLESLFDLDEFWESGRS